MNFERIAAFFSSLTFRQAVWLVCPAFTLHVLEEWPHFTDWAKQYASPQFTQHDYNLIHGAGIISTILTALVLWLFPKRPIVFLYFAFSFTPAIFFNSIFHAGATAASGVYCPGLITALTIYPPLFVFISRLAWREGLLQGKAGLTSVAIAGTFHALEVGHNVFKAW